MIHPLLWKLAWHLYDKNHINVDDETHYLINLDDQTLIVYWIVYLFDEFRWSNPYYLISSWDTIRSTWTKISKIHLFPLWPGTQGSLEAWIALLRPIRKMCAVSADDGTGRERAYTLGYPTVCYEKTAFFIGKSSANGPFLSSFHSL